MLKTVTNDIPLSSLLAARRKEILDRWARRIAHEHADKALSAGELWDHLPDFFEEMLLALRNPGGASQELSGVKEAGPSAAHGAQRLRVGFDVAQVHREYEILTDCILDEIEAVGHNVTGWHFRRIHQLIDAGRVEALSAYVDRRDKDVARAHSQHVAFLAHELRNPLAAARMAVQSLRHKERLEDQWEVGVLTRTLTLLSELIDKVLTAERLGERAAIDREEINLAALIDEIVSDCAPTAEHRHVKIVVEASAKLRLDGDRRLLRSAIENVVGNAIKFSREHGRVTVRANTDNDWVVIEVLDSCGGLPGEDATRLFEPFVQGSENRSGFGLGLAIVWQAIRAHGGAVNVRNVGNEGCIFSLKLPTSMDPSYVAVPTATSRVQDDASPSVPSLPRP